MMAGKCLKCFVSAVKSVRLSGPVNNAIRRYVHSSPGIAGTARATQAKPQHSEANRQARLDLAAAYRGLEKLNLHEGVCNHVTLLAPAADGNGEVMLVIPYGLHWSEVTASCLLGTNKKGEVVEGEGRIEESAACIHLGVRHKRKQRCVVHTHAPYLTALTTLKDPKITMTHQNAMRFYNKIAYDTNFEGPGTSMEEGRRLGDVLGDKQVMMMGNHGIMTVSDSVAVAFDSLYYLERVAMFQVLAMSTGKDLRHIPEHVCQAYVEKYNDEIVRTDYAEPHFQSMIRRLHRESSDFAA